MPRVDGVFLTEDPLYLVQQGVVVDIPFVSGTTPFLSIFLLIEPSVRRELRRRRDSLLIGDHQHYVRDT